MEHGFDGLNGFTQIFFRVSLRDKGIPKSRDGFIRFINFFSSFSFLILLVFFSFFILGYGGV